jgi:hypothetical protein
MTRIEWDKISHLSTEDICQTVELEVQGSILGNAVGNAKKLRPDKLAMQIMSQVSDEESKSWRPFWLSVLPFSNPSWENLEWKILQRLFQRDFKLPHNFDYTKYLRLKLLEAMGHQLHVSVLTWGIVLGLVIFYVVLAYGYAAAFSEPAEPCLSGLNSTIITEVPGCDGVSSLSGKTECDVECTGLAFVVSLGVCSGCMVDGTTPITAENVGTLSPPTVTCDVAGASDTSDCDDAGVRRRQLGEGQALSSASAWTQQLFQLTLAWILVAGQIGVVYFTKNAIHKLLRAQTPPLERPTAASMFLRKLEAQLNVRLQLQSIPLFHDKGDNFYGELSRHLDVEFHDANTVIVNEGDPGDSMLFVVEGNVEIVDEADVGYPGGVIGVLEAGDYAGEMSMLLGEKRPRTLRAGGQDVILCVLRESQLKDMEKEHKFGLGEMREQASKRKSDHGQKVDQKVASPVAKHGHDDGGHGHGGGHKHAHGLLPTMGSPHGKHGHGGKHRLADEIMSEKAKGRFTIFAELTLLLNCFQCSYYILHVMHVVVPGTGAPIGMQMLLHFLFAFPAGLVMCFLSPMSAKYQCILTSALFRDDEVIAVITGDQEMVVKLRNRIRSTLMHTVLLDKRDEKNVTSEDVAAHIFKVLDEDGGGKIETKELKRGLQNFGIFLTKKELNQMLRTIDPDQNGGLDYSEWLNFMQASDEALGGDNWQVSFGRAVISETEPPNLFINLV